MPFFSPNQYVIEGFQTSCSFDYIDQSTFTRVMVITSNIFGFCVPITIIITCYILIFFYLKKNSKSIYLNKHRRQTGFLDNESSLKNSGDLLPNSMINFKTTRSKSVIGKSLSLNDALNDISSLNRQPSLKRVNSYIGQTYHHTAVVNKNISAFIRRSSRFFRKKNFNEEWQITHNSIFIISLFCLTWLPYSILSLVGHFSALNEKYITPKMTLFPVLCAKLSSILNAVLYMNGNKNFKRKFKKLLKSLFKRKTVCKNSNHNYS